MTGAVRERAPGAGPPPVLDLPTFASRRLENGLRVDVARATTTPDVALRLVLQAGAGTVPPERGGLTSLACDLLSEGAGGRSAPEMARWIDGLGASFHARPSYDAVTLSMHAMNDQLGAALEFLAAVCRRPDFAPGEVERRRDMVLDRLRRRVDDPAEVVADALGAAVFGAHPYGAPLGGTIESVERLEASTLADYWRSRVRPDTACLVVCGDVEPDAAFDTVAAEFGDWTTSSGPAPEVPAVPTVAARAGDVLLLDRPSSRQTELRIGGVGIARGDSGEEEALVMNAILGGLFSSRINLNLREEKGWTYGARTALLRRRRPGLFLLRTAVATEVTASAFDEVLAEFERMCGAPPEPAELELATNALTRSLPLQFQTASQLAHRQAESVAYGLPEDYWERFPELVRAVEPGHVLDAARRLLGREGLVLLAAGAVAGFESVLGRLGRVSVTVPEGG